jgi:hypothetical protein
VFQESWFFLSAVEKASQAFSGTAVFQSGRGFVNTAPEKGTLTLVKGLIDASPESSILRWSSKSRILESHDGTEHFGSGLSDRESVAVSSHFANAVSMVDSLTGRLPAAGAASTNPSTNLSSWVIIAISLGFLLLVVVITVAICLVRRNRDGSRSRSDEFSNWYPSRSMPTVDEYEADRWKPATFSEE